MVKRLPTKQETQLRSLGQENALEKEMATHSSISAWEVPGTGELGGLQSRGHKRVRHNLVAKTTTMYVLLLKHYLLRKVSSSHLIAFVLYQKSFGHICSPFTIFKFIYVCVCVCVGSVCGRRFVCLLFIALWEMLP